MDALFGLSMNTIMIVLLALFFIIVLVIAFIALTNRIVFMMGLRNIPRRMSQTVLIVIGLMLSTVIITAAFATGDTVDYSITKQTYDLARHTDIILDGEVGISEEATGDPSVTGNNISGDDYRAFLAGADNGDLQYVDGYTGILIEPVPVINTSTNLSEPSVALTGVDETRMDAFPDVVDVDAGEVLELADLGPAEVYVNQSAADELSANTGDVLEIYVAGEPHEFTVKAIVEDTLVAAATDFEASEGITAPLAVVQELFQKDEVTVVAVSAVGGIRDTLGVIPQAEEEVREIIGPGITSEGESFHLRMEVSDTKLDFVEDAEEIGNFMTTFFLILGLFSIGAGVLLIVMIFVMLAAERKSEMGMARAVGMKRGHLVQMFVSEGGTYNLAAATVGVILGVVVAFLLTTAASAIFSTFGFTFTPHVTARTLVVSFCLGFVLTFITVSFSSWRISSLNIVAAIRDTEEGHSPNPEAGTVRGYLRGLLNAFVALLSFIGPFMYVLRGTNFAREREERYVERKAPWFPFPAGFIGIGFYQIAMLLTRRQPIPQWPFYTIILSPLYLAAIVITLLTRDHRPSSMPWWLVVLGIGWPLPVGVVLVGLQDRERPISWGAGLWSFFFLLGALFFYMGIAGDSAFPFALGFSLMCGGFAVVLTYFGANARATFTTMGLVLLVFWGLTAGGRLEDIFGTLNGNFEMFFLSGVAMVTASTFVIIYNGDLILALVSRVGSRFGSILPALRTAIAYPMANRFRTGMTLAMISLVVFALTTMSTMNLNYVQLVLRDESRGGWDVVVAENPNNPIPSITEALDQAGASDISDEIAGEGAVRQAGFDSASEVTQDGEEWSDYSVSGLTDGFIDNSSIPLDKMAIGYEDERAVWEAVRDDPNLAIIDRFTLESGFGTAGFHLEGVPLNAKTFEPPTVTVRDAATGESRDVQVIGIISEGASNNFLGLFLNEEAFLETFGEPEFSVHYAALVDPDAAGDVADDIEATLVTTGAQAKSLQELVEEATAFAQSFLHLMQAFMGLGLVVGIAAIGVIAFRTVVERRQQIGMLRAIGFKKSQVQLAFMLESSFVTILGVTAGAVLGLWLAYFLVTSDDFAGGTNTFHVPWLELTVINVLTIAASLLMTLIPARQAASVPTAEALRYE